MLRVRNIKIRVDQDSILNIKNKVAKYLHIKEENILELNINKQSIDARSEDVFFVYEVDIKINNENKILQKKLNNVLVKPNEEYIYPKVKNNLKPIIIGSGPAGLFCSYLLAKLGYRPIIIEQGEKVEDRVKTVEEFFNNNKLNAHSNIQFGEGGAGTFSDGKLNTLVKDKEHRGRLVFDIFVENGAPENIKYIAHPHIGTDILRKVIINMRNKIISMGGTFKYNTTLTDLLIKDNRLVGIKVNNEIISCDTLVLAIGHSARNTFYMLYEKGLEMLAKPFAIGVRVIHPQELINNNQYGKYAKYLEPASYKLTYQSKNNRGVYSFCMCPGGYVINASSEEGHLAVNGMSNYKRDSSYANSAIVVTVNKDDFGNNPLSGIEFQRDLEKKAYNLGRGLIPVQLFKDYEDNKISTKDKSIPVITKGNYTFTNLNDLFPSYINESLKEGINYFNNRIKGFNNDDVPILGIESRTSSPVIIKRDEFGESNIKGIYPCGEGAGYAGGITTAAMDGIKIAEFIAQKQ